MNLNLYLIKHYFRHFFQAHRKGHGIHSPFAYQLCEEVFYNRHPFYELKRLRDLRQSLSQNNTIIRVEDFGAGSKVFKSNERVVSQLVKSGTSSVKQSEILFRLSNFLNAKTSLELGTSIGLNALYLAMVNSSHKVVSVEGSAELAAFASKLANDHHCKNLEIKHAKFDEILPTLLPQLHSIDLLYIDGNHTYEATMRYLQLALPYMNKTGVVVLDDIYWSQGMTKAWKEACELPQVTLSIDGFYFGMLFFKEELKEKVNLKMMLS